MLKLFISHASEDKDDLVRPLVAELKKDFDVWFDEYELKLGDSLRGKIDAGLRACDYGIVVLSPSFFAKKWTVEELNGLFALEDANAKLILPIWHNVDVTVVRNFSPMLAGRRAALSSKGIQQIVEEIRISVGASGRTHEILVPNRGLQAFRNLVGKISSWQLDEKILRSTKGVRLFERSIKRIGELIWGQLQADQEKRHLFRFEDRGIYFVIYGPFHIFLVVSAQNGFANTVREAEILVRIYRDKSMDGVRGEEEELERTVWTITCMSEDSIGFRKKGDSVVISEEDLASFILERFCLQIADRLNQINNH